MRLKLSVLRDLSMDIDAIALNKALGVVADLRIKKLGKSAKEKVNSEIKESLDAVSERVKELREEHIKTARKESGDDAVNSKFKQLWLADEELAELAKEENDLWNTEVDFMFEPPVIRLKGDESDKFSNEATTVEFGFIKKEIFAYSAFLGLVDEGYIVIEE